MRVHRKIRNYYTDVLCHEFSPSNLENGDIRVAVGTNFGDVYMIGEADSSSQSVTSNEDSSASLNDTSSEVEGRFSPECIWHTTLPGEDEEPVVALAWDTCQTLFVMSNRFLYRMQGNDLEGGTAPLKVFGPLPDSHDLMHFALLNDSNSICLVSDDWKTRIIDKETQKVKLEFQGHDGIVQVCRTTAEYVATGGVDGFVRLYEPQFRTKRTICSFGDPRNAINNLDISRNSVWLASSGVESSEFPTVYNIRSGKEVPFTSNTTKTTETEQISALHFDSRDSLYWGGSSGSVFKSDDLLISHSELKATYGIGAVPQVLSIHTRDFDSGGTQLSVAGATNAVLFSSRGLYWDSMIHLEPPGLKTVPSKFI